MKILQAAKFYYPYRGGMETVVKILSEQLVLAGHEVTVLCVASERESLRKEVVNGVTVVRAGSYGSLFSQPLSADYFFKLRELAPSFDVIHFHAPHPLAEVGALMMLSGDKPAVATFHCDITRQRLLAAPYYKLFRRFLSRMGAIAVSSRNLAKNSLALQEYEGPCEVIPFGLGDEASVVDSETMSASRLLKNQYGRFFLFVGRLVHYKGLFTLVEAFAELKRNNLPYKVFVVGDGPVREELRQKIDELGLSETVFLLGPISGSLKPYFDACDALILPSLDRSEAFGLVLIEAMALGRPLLTSRLDTGVTEVNEDGRTGLHFTPGDSHELALAIQRVYQDDRFRESAGQEAHKKFLSTYRAAIMMKSYEALYLRNLKGRPH